MDYLITHTADITGSEPCRGGEPDLSVHRMLVDDVSSMVVCIHRGREAITVR